MQHFKIFHRKWVSFADRAQNISELLPLPEAFRKGNFEAYLPPRIELSLQEQETLLCLEAQGGYWSGDDFSKMRRLQIIRGRKPEEYETYMLAPLKKLLTIQETVGIILPESYLRFFQNLDYINRFRTGDESFFVEYPIIPFPGNSDFFLLPFFGDSQGFGWWSLLLDKNSEHVVIYNAYHWNEIDLPAVEGDIDDKNYYICADSFDEFIKRLSIDMRLRGGETLDEIIKTLNK